MKDYSGEDFIMMPIPYSMFSAVCAVLGGAAGNVLISPVPTPAGGAAGNVAPISDALDEYGNSTEGNAPGVLVGEVDIDGHPFDAKLHTGTITKAGLWRMKAGVSRPEPMPGFPKDAGTGTASSGEEPQAGNTATGANASEDDEDEFAAFRAAADKSEATDKKAAAEVPARKWTDADLGVLCNQAATKLNDPAPVMDMIKGYVPSGEVPKSRNIPADQREAFAQAVEAKFGIEFAG